MRVLPINNYQNSYNYQRTNYDCKHAAPVAFGHSANPGAARRVGKGVMGILCALSMAAMSLFNSSCQKEPVTPDPVVPDNPTPDNPTPVNPTLGKDLVDFAFRDLVGTFGLDTVGRTKTLQMSYPFNEGDYMVDNFEPQTKQDTMYANGVYHYTGSDESIPRETPYRVMWTKTDINGHDAALLEYDYGNKDSVHWPIPHLMVLAPEEEGDNMMHIYVPRTADSTYETANITGNNAECSIHTTDGGEHHFNNPFNVNITANYPNK